MNTRATDAIVVGAGLAGLVAATEIADAGHRVLLLDQEGEQNLGGQAFWSLGGLFFIDSPEQRRLGIRDSAKLAHDDWMQSARFDRAEDYWPRRWAEAYLEFAANEKRAWLHARGVRWFPAVGWAERGGVVPGLTGNSVPRFHLTWGTGPAVLEPFITRAREHQRLGRLRFGFRQRVRELVCANQNVVGVRGDVLEPTLAPRGAPTSRAAIGEFEAFADHVVVTSGGIGGNHELVRRYWPVDRLGPAPAFMVAGVPAYVDGALQESALSVGARRIHVDRMWHYTEGLRNWSPVWANHGIRILPGPTSLWLNPRGERLPFPHIPGANSLAALQHITTHGYPYTWFLTNRATLKREFALSGSEQNPDLTGKSVLLTLKRVGKAVQAPVQNFLNHGADFVLRDSVRDLAEGMNRLVESALVDPRSLEHVLKERDAALTAGGDPQLEVVRAARKYVSERLLRVAKEAPLLEPAHGPLVAVRLNVLTRKSLGGLETDLQARALRADGSVIQGLYAAGEVAGFGGGGMHGYSALEGTFLGGCLFSGRAAGRAVVSALR